MTAPIVYVRTNTPTDIELDPHPQRGRNIATVAAAWDADGLPVRGTLWERIAELDPTPAWPVAPEGYGRDPWHDREAGGVCRVCGAPADDWEPNYSEYVDRWYRDEYEGEPGHTPMDEALWSYLKNSCAGPWAAPDGFVSSVEIPRPCGATRPQTLGYQRCERVAGHSHFHRSQDDVRWNDVELACADCGSGKAGYSPTAEMRLCATCAHNRGVHLEARA